MSELKKCCRYCSKFSNNACQLNLFEISFDGISYELFEKFEDVGEIDDLLYEAEQNISPKNPDDFCCNHYS